MLESRSIPGPTSYIVDLMLDPIPEARIQERTGRSVSISGVSASLTSFADRLRAPGLASTSVDAAAVVAVFESTELASKFELDEAGLVGGSHELGSGLRLEPREPGSKPLELVPAPRNRHWRLLNGGHVDVVPRIQPDEAARLEDVSSVVVVESPPTVFIALLFGARLNAGQRSAVRAVLDTGSIADAVCDSDCASDLPPRVEVLDNPGSLPQEIELFYQLAGTEGATGVRVIAHQLLEQGVRVTAKPTNVADLLERFRTRDFDLALIPAPTSSERFEGFLNFFNIEPEDVGRELIPLWRVRQFTAYDASVCGAKPTSASSSAWLSKVYRCEVAQ